MKKADVARLLAKIETLDTVDQVRAFSEMARKLLDADASSAVMLRVLELEAEPAAAPPAKAKKAKRNVG